MISMAIAKKMLNTFSVGALNTKGFKKVSPLSYLSYCKKYDSFDAHINIPIRRDPRGFMAANYHIIIHYLPITEFLDNPMVAVPKSTVMGTLEFKEWLFSTEEELEQLLNGEMGEVLLMATNYLDEYCQLEKFLENLQSPDPVKRYPIDPKNKDEKIIAILAATGQSDKALQMLSELLEKYKGGPPKYLRPLLELQVKIKPLA